MFGLQQYAITVLLVLAVVVVGNYELSISDLKVKSATLEVKLHSCKVNADRFSDSIEDLNFEIDTYKAWNSEADKEIGEWKSKPKDIRYKVIYQTISQDINLSKGDCQDVKSINNSLKSISYSDF